MSISLLLLFFIAMFLSVLLCFVLYQVITAIVCVNNLCEMENEPSPQDILDLVRWDQVQQSYIGLDISFKLTDLDFFSNRDSGSEANSGSGT